ncbi:hypothetical protein B0F90DRAFT_1699521 [Multifurca ochricompacta]|uniref:Protein yippee-like n=1 Tax=Multifurca ochricompacta TaxID=376703 RepID=A0AAD4QPH2_9AGAM|nr:hypothetical protein B0F90DRAFT_1699521 [Multifurca ochricompacta]
MSSASRVVHVFEGHPSFYCSNCSAVIASVFHISLPSQIRRLIPSAYAVHNRGSRLTLLSCGSLMHSAVNVRMGSKEDRPLLTGVHTVADVFCIGCGDRLGWYYHKASDQSQKYKEGKYLLERERLVKDNAWTLGV